MLESRVIRELCRNGKLPDSTEKADKSDLAIKDFRAGAELV